MLHFLLPKELHPIFDHIPSSALHVVGWGSVLPSVITVGRRLAFDEGKHEMIADLTPLLPAHVQFSLEHRRCQHHRQDDEADTHPGLINAEHLSEDEAERKRFGEAVLEVFFSQLFSEKGFFIDLREHGFSLDAEAIYWNPPNLWYHLEHNFRIGLLKIYEGYFFGPFSEVEAGLSDLGLFTEDHASNQKVVDLLLSHFGTGEQRDVLFEIEPFAESFEQFFDYLKAKNMQLDANFIYFGIYLITLYLCLDKLKVPLDAREAFTNARTRLAKENLDNQMDSAVS
ncbi:hypothetical protein Ctha_0437 [Chloroherpeton thalassium ATCC 35110]|uniref:Uncharacterized protein n=1 Tax=Chloroherpeton thalassium (strain ATCC 35110 / GB-78) TaxID=517418 RepID=B3QUK2_CHLT3|nr:hypothetical protein [Chloroherpeton thalassium]ACF12908.1 hypothetical protein Ctha_0437 [Chloroherpeton thalassium ATCC 35110]